MFSNRGKKSITIKLQREGRRTEAKSSKARAGKKGR